MKRKVIKLAYHRNGISGYPFYVCIIKDDDGSRKVAIRMPKLDDKTGNAMCFVLDIDRLNSNIIGMYEEEGNAWRGDMYTDIIDKAINQNTKITPENLHIKPKEKKNVKTKLL